MAAARRALGRRPVRVAARLSLILLLAAGLAGLTLIAAPAHAGGDGSGATTALLGAAPAPAASFTPGLPAPLGEELRGSDYGKDWQHCVQVVANLRAKHPEVPLVVLLGGSSARECTVLDDNWEQQIKRRSGYVVDAYNLGSKHRTYAQDLAFVKLLPGNVPTIVYIGINLGRFCLPVTSASITLPQAAAAVLLPRSTSTPRTTSRATPGSATTSRIGFSRRYPEFRANYSSELVHAAAAHPRVQAAAPADRAGRPAARPARHRLLVRRPRVALPGRLRETRERPGGSRGCTSTAQRTSWTATSSTSSTWWSRGASSSRASSRTRPSGCSSGTACRSPRHRRARARLLRRHPPSRPRRRRPADHSRVTG